MLRSRRRNPEDEELDENGEPIDTTPKRPSAIQYFDEFRREQSISSQWTSGTMECWAAFRKHLFAVAKGNSFDFFNDDGTEVKLHDYEGNEYEKVVYNATALAKTRDMFCFCAFTSLRYSDMAALKRTDISGD